MTGAGTRPSRPRVAAVMAVGCVVVMTFYIALTLGAPLGAAALGGTISGPLPPSLRLVSALTAVVWVFITLVVLARGGHAIFPVPRAVAMWGTWVIVGMLAFATLLNLASFSPWERFGWAPFSFALLVLGIALARSRPPVGAPRASRASASQPRPAR